MSKRTEKGKLLAVGDVAERISVSNNTIRRWSKSGQFPEPVVIGRSIRWPEREVDEWIANRKGGVRHS